MGEKRGGGEERTFTESEYRTVRKENEDTHRGRKNNKLQRNKNRKNKGTINSPTSACRKTSHTVEKLLRDGVERINDSMGLSEPKSVELGLDRTPLEPPHLLSMYNENNALRLGDDRA